MIHTPDHQEFLWSLKNLSDHSHTADFLAVQIEEVINKIGNDNFSAIVSDAGANIKLARHHITSKYPYMLNVRCIAHAINLISKDICKTPFANKILRRCMVLVKYFKASHLPGNILELLENGINIFNLIYYIIYFLGQTLKNLAIESGVEGGRLKKWVDTRWHTMYDCVESVIFHRVPLETVSF